MMKIHPSVLCFLFIGSLGLNSCEKNKGAEQKGPPPVQVSAIAVTSRQAVFYDQYPASVTPLSQVDIRPQVSGYVTNVWFKDGQHVTKGMKLYGIDQQLYKSAYDQSMANLNVAKANLARAKQDADRYRELAKKDAVARQTLEHAVADLQSMKMQVTAAEANVKSVQTNLRYSILYAPFDGTIGISLVKLGSAVMTGQTILNTVSSDHPMAVDCSVDEKQIGRFTQLLNKGMDDRDSTFTLILPDQTVYPGTGHIIFLDRSVDSQTGTIRIRVVFPNDNSMLKAGLTCNLRVLSNSAENSLMIPYRAVTEQMGEYFVFVVDSNKVTQRRIVLGMTMGDLVVVKEGLQAGNQIVTEGVQKLRDNAQVVVVPANVKSVGTVQNR